MQHWFVYYKLSPALAREVEPRLRRLQQEVAAASGARTRLMRRTDGGDGGGDAPVTLLEVYDGIAQPEAFESALSAAVAGAGLPTALAGQRRTEKFEEI